MMWVLKQLDFDNQVAAVISGFDSLVSVVDYLEERYEESNIYTRTESSKLIICKEFETSNPTVFLLEKENETN